MAVHFPGSCAVIEMDGSGIAATMPGGMLGDPSRFLNAIGMPVRFPCSTHAETQAADAPYWEGSLVDQIDDRRICSSW